MIIAVARKIVLKLKKIRRMRILSTVFFLSFLAGKFKEMKRTQLRKIILNTTNRGGNKT